MLKNKLFIPLLCVLLLCGCAPSDPPESPAGDGEDLQSAEPDESAPPYDGGAPADIDADIYITVKTGEGRTPISPYIYGVNEFVMDREVTALSVRQGGNRYTAYNWENNLSNAGSDWHHFSDNWLSSSADPAFCALDMAARSAEKNIPYMITTLQMAGFVSADGDRTVNEDETAPSHRFHEVVFAKNAPFDDPPNLEDNYVYMDEYVNYLVTRLGSGVMNYGLDNEPALWASTHPRVRPRPVGCAELIEKSTALAAAVKAVDPQAAIFGPMLYGIGAYNDLQSAPDWAEVNSEYKYDWFVSYYLDQMAKSEAVHGVRLLDVLAVHYYSEARGECRVVYCNDQAHTSCVEARLQSARSLWEDGFIEDSWIGQWMKHCLPVINRLNESIDKYYPGTKLAFTEYSLGGGSQISGAIAQADILGVFGRMGVFLATLWPDAGRCDHQLSAINLFTNFDGKGSSFGNTSVSAETSDIEKAYAYAAIHGQDDSRVTLVVSNKSLTEYKYVEITLESPAAYSSADVYMISGDSHAIAQGASVPVGGNKLIYKLPPLSVTLFDFSP
jgi:hypothetical protein